MFVCLPCTSMAPRTTCLLLLLFFIASTRVSLVVAVCGDLPTPEPCVVDAAKNCANCMGGEKVPNPFDCTSYYICKNGTTFLFDDPFPCPDGETFNLSDKKCKVDGVCTTDCDKPGGDGGCFYTCVGNPGGLIADPFDCSVYHQCTRAPNTKAGPAMTCPADTPYFNGEKCVTDESACCHCRPYCYEGEFGMKVEDPTDCRKFFYCLEEDEIPDFTGECRDGEHFDMHVGECSSTAPCMTLCRNVVDENGCIDPYTCQEIGYFPKCKTQCLREFYHCVEVSDDYATPETCPNNLVFNPDTLTCIKNETCPYNYK